MKKNQGQILINLILITVIVTVIISAVVNIVMSNTIGSSKTQQGLTAFQTAETGIENALLRLLRDPNYTGETMTINGGTDVITVTGTQTNKTILSVGTVGNFQRKIQSNITYNNFVLTVTSWQEVL